jgi:beta-galactosidase
MSFVLPKNAIGLIHIDILVEALGRLNFGHSISYDRKGITKNVLLDGKKLNNWSVYPLPMEA